MKKIACSIIIIVTIVILGTGCSELNEINHESSSVAESELELQDDSPVPEEFSQEETYIPLNFPVHKAMWFGYMDYEDILYNKTEQEFTKAIVERFTKANVMGINTLYVQVRAFNDAYYQSDIFPKGKYYNGDFDPLTIMINAAHALGMSFHAWINPLRCQTDSELNEVSDVFLTKKWYNDDDKNGNYIVLIEDKWYLNPAYEEVRNLVYDGIKEIVSSYDVDGIHIDDYFYPTTDTAFDAASFSESNASDLSIWRIDNINKLVKGMYYSVKSVNKKVLFGISPQGNIDKNLSVHYADVTKWGAEDGFCDYLVPQLYYGFNHSTCPFESTALAWRNLVKSENVKLVAGICTYKTAVEDIWAGDGKEEWITDLNVASKEMQWVFDNEEYEGVAIFSYASTFEPDGDKTIQEALEVEIEKFRSILLD